MAKKARGQRRDRGSAEVRDKVVQLGDLPPVDALADAPTFSNLRLDDAQCRAFEEFCAEAEAPDEMHIGFVIRLDRGFPLVACEGTTFRAEHAVSFAKRNREKDDMALPAVGDAVAIRLAPGHDRGVIERVLPRRSTFERWRGKNRGERQVLCANVDRVLIVAALGAGEVLLDRIARSLVLAADCGAAASVVLTKADRCTPEELAEEVARVRRLVGEHVDVVVTSSLAGEGLDPVRACVPEGTVAMILDERGACPRRCGTSHHGCPGDGEASRRGRDCRRPGFEELAARGARAGTRSRVSRGG